MHRLAAPWRRLLLLLPPLALLRPAASLRARLPAASETAALRREEGQAKIFFLMMSEDGIPLQDIWLDFLSGGKNGENYEVFLHCTDFESCMGAVKRQDIFQIIPTVPSEYCYNLVDPQLALVRAALGHVKNPNPHDKFVLVSHNSLPVKPFWYVYVFFTDHQENTASFFQSSEWDQSCGLTKASQFSALSWLQADKLVKSASNTSRALPNMTVCPGCLDEYFALRAIYGEEQLAKFPKEVPKYMHWQRKFMWVDFVHKGEFLNAHRSPGTQAEEAAEEDEAKRRRRRGPLGPASFAKITIPELQEFRNMEGVCFARKFLAWTGLQSEGPHGRHALRDAFKKYVYLA